MEKNEVVVISGVRTAVGDFGGSLKNHTPSQLGAAVVKEAVARAGVDAVDIGHCVMGNVIHTEARDMYKVICAQRMQSKKGISRSKFCRLN